jgi:predicted nucleotidyltransferase
LKKKNRLLKNLSFKKKALPKKNYTLGTIKRKEKEPGYELDRIINVLRKDIKIKLIMLFGSLARGDMNRMSDMDMIIVKETGIFFSHILMRK